MTNIEKITTKFAVLQFAPIASVSVIFGAEMVKNVSSLWFIGALLAIALLTFQNRTVVEVLKNKTLFLAGFIAIPILGLSMPYAFPSQSILMGFVEVSSLLSVFISIFYYIFIVTFYNESALKELGWSIS